MCRCRRYIPFFNISDNTNKFQLNCRMLASHYMPGVKEAGCDEAGRGCIAGPVFASAVILPEDFKDPILNDSKQLSADKRYRLRKIIEANAIDFAVAMVSAEEIDSMNILQASIHAMHKALDMLRVRPEYIIADGNRFHRYREIPYTCFVKGDGRFQSIAAASVLAKTYRDDFMKEASANYPQYGWEQNFGYPTKAHRKAIEKYGISPLHRKTFRLLPDPVLF